MFWFSPWLTRLSQPFKMNERVSLFDVKELARYLNVSDKTVTKYARLKKIPGFKLDHIWRFRKSMVDNWINKRIKAKKCWKTRLKKRRKRR